LINSASLSISNVIWLTKGGRDLDNANQRLSAALESINLNGAMNGMNGSTAILLLQKEKAMQEWRLVICPKTLIFEEDD